MEDNTSHVKSKSSDMQDNNLYQLNRRLDHIESLFNLELNKVENKFENKFENKIEILDSTIKRNIPHDLSNRLNIMEHKLNNDVRLSKLESDTIITSTKLSDSLDNLNAKLSDSKATMKERLAFITIIVALIAIIATLLK